MIDRRIDDEVGIIYVVGTGIWTRDEVDRHYDALRALIAEFRLKGRRVRLLSNISGAERQDPALEEHIVHQQEKTFRAGDRVAILTANEEDRNYVREVVGDIEIALFKSQLAAEMWLLHDTLDLPTRDKGRHPSH